MNSLGLIKRLQLSKFHVLVADGIFDIGYMTLYFVDHIFDRNRISFGFVTVGVCFIGVVDGGAVTVAVGHLVLVLLVDADAVGVVVFGGALVVVARLAMFAHSS
jgi:hypothetical protein